MCIEWHQAAQKFQWDTSTALPATSGVGEEFVEGGLFWEEAWCPSHSIILPFLPVLSNTGKRLYQGCLDSVWGCLDDVSGCLADVWGSIGVI